MRKVRGRSCFCCVACLGAFVCAEPESWPVLLGRVGGATADAWVLVFSRVGVGKEGEGTCLVGSLPLSFFVVWSR